jgi:hypothetical protein
LVNHPVIQHRRPSLSISLSLAIAGRRRGHFQHCWKRRRSTIDNSYGLGLSLSIVIVIIDVDCQRRRSSSIAGRFNMPFIIPSQWSVYPKKANKWLMTKHHNLTFFQLNFEDKCLTPHIIRKKISQIYLICCKSSAFWYKGQSRIFFKMIIYFGFCCLLKRS